MKGQSPRTVANNETIQVPAGTQALARTERVQVRILGGRAGVLRCPSLTAALLLKSRAIRLVHRDQDRQDLVVLLSCVDDPFGVKQQLTKKQLDWLQKAAVRLRIEEPDLSDLFAREQLARARAAYRLLTVG